MGFDVLRMLPVHPHVRGEHSQRLIIEHVDNGSSPRAWGTQTNIRWGAHQRRFIPTCVGNTRHVLIAINPNSVHPHVRGEHAGVSSREDASPGSSPRAWGTRGHHHLTPVARRFIPTCVGNTPLCRRRSMATPVHPHVRGEHARRHTERTPQVGSSPRAWGTRNCVIS